MCDKNIHNDLISLNEISCPFCGELMIKERISSDFNCCLNKNIEEVDGHRICIVCGVVHSYICESDFIDFYMNMYKFRRTSVYIRKYHIENKLNKLLINKEIKQLTYNQRHKIYKIFDKIGEIIHKINENRKRIINIKFILIKIFDMMGIEYNIPVTQSRKTLIYYNEYWMKIINMIGYKIKLIIDK